MAKSQNCWDFMKCDFGPDRTKRKTKTVCAAAKESRLDGVHGGRFGGRACWFVNDTSECGVGASGDFSNKYPVCMNCKFYWKVREEEGEYFEMSLLLNTYLRDK